MLQKLDKERENLRDLEMNKGSAEKKMAKLRVCFGLLFVFLPPCFVNLVCLKFHIG